MPSIFNDERRGIGSIWPNPEGTPPLSAPDVVANRLKWHALLRDCRLASADMDDAGAVSEPGDTF
jgi:hypothetical protein